MVGEIWIRFAMCDGGARAIVLCRLPTLPAGGRPQSTMVCPTKVTGSRRVGLPGLAPPRSLQGEDFSISCCIRLHLLHWRRLAGQNRRRLRWELSKNEGVPGRTPCGECGEPFRRGGYSLSYIRVAREFLEIGGLAVLRFCFQWVREGRT